MSELKSLKFRSGGDNKASFVLEKEGEKMAEIRFHDSGEVHITNTNVDPSLRGQGIAGKLVQAVIDYAKEHNKKITSECSYASKVLERKGLA